MKYLVEHEAGAGEGINREHRQKHRLDVQGVVIPDLIVAQQRKHHGQPGTLYKSNKRLKWDRKPV